MNSQLHLFGQLDIDDCAAAAEDDSAAAAVDQDRAARIRRQDDLAAQRDEDVRDHRRGCGYCIPGHLCRDGRKAEKEARIARDVLRLMKAGEI